MNNINNEVLKDEDGEEVALEEILSSLFSGMTKEDAIGNLEYLSWDYRFISPSEEFKKSEVINNNRLNLVLENDIIIKAFVG